MSDPDNLGDKFPAHVHALLKAKRDTVAPVKPSTEVREPIDGRRGVGIGTLLAFTLISVGVGAGTWEIYGGKVRSQLDIVGYEPQPAKTLSAPLAVAEAAHDEALLGLVRDIRKDQKHSTDQLETILQSLAVQQALTKTARDALAALNVKIDALSGAHALAAQPTAVENKSAPAAPRRKRSARPKPPLPLVSQEPVDQPAPPSDAAVILRR